MNEIRQIALTALQETSWDAKVAWIARADANVPIDLETDLKGGGQLVAHIPGRPALSFVPPAGLLSRSVHTQEGRAVLIHALAHIEFNAINLALDVVWRFSGMPKKFYRDWMGVAREEAEHYRLLSAHLADLGYCYGDFPAHDGLWEMAERTQDDVLARLALVPRTLEARGLDASPAVRHKLASGGDRRGAEIVDLILREEIGHVAIGNYWYRWLCAQRGVDPVTQYAELALTYRAPKLKGPFNVQARIAAGFEPEEIEALQRQ
ncbi:MAG: ferritin-like domain-containing protein [Betaproteobacteria bacterium]